MWNNCQPEICNSDVLFFHHRHLVLFRDKRFPFRAYMSIGSGLWIDFKIILKICFLTFYIFFMNMEVGSFMATLHIFFLCMAFQAGLLSHLQLMVQSTNQLVLQIWSLDHTNEVNIFLINLLTYAKRRETKINLVGCSKFFWIWSFKLQFYIIWFRSWW